MSAKRRPVRHLLRLYPGADDDLIRWLSRFDNQPYGVKAQAVREALRRGLEAAACCQAPASSTSDLAELRQVVEAAVASALAHFEGLPGRRGPAADEADDETERLLDDLASALILKE